MIVLAVLLLAVVALLMVASFVGSSEGVTISFLNITIDTTVAGVFLAGVVSGLVALASLVVLRISLRRWWKRREEVRDLRQRAEQAGAGTPADDEAAATTSQSDADTGRPTGEQKHKREHSARSDIAAGPNTGHEPPAESTSKPNEGSGQAERRE